MCLAHLEMGFSCIKFNRGVFFISKLRRIQFSSIWFDVSMICIAIHMVVLFPCYTQLQALLMFIILESVICGLVRKRAGQVGWFWIRENERKSTIANSLLHTHICCTGTPTKCNRGESIRIWWISGYLESRCYTGKLLKPRRLCSKLGIMYWRKK